MTEVETSTRKRRQAFLILSFVLLAGLCLLAGATAAFLLLDGRIPGQQTTSGGEVPSPDGAKILVTRIETSQADPTTYLTVKFEIRDAATGEVLFRGATGASDRMRWSMHWVSNKEVRLMSSDIGDYCWTESGSGDWERSEC